MAKTTKKKVTTQAPAQGQELRRATPVRPLSPFEEMDRMFENFFRRGWMRPFHSDWPSFGELAPQLELRAPRVDVVDRDADIVVRAEVPGVEKKDLDVSLTDNTVTIKGSTQHEEKEEKGNYYRSEISRGAFARTVALPSDVDTAKAKAEFRDGVLELTLPKVAKAKRRSIKIS